VRFEELASHGVTDAVLSLGYLPDRFIEAYPSGVIAGVRVTYAVETGAARHRGRHPLRGESAVSTRPFWSSTVTC